jgi:hypothetical protein
MALAELLQYLLLALGLLAVIAADMAGRNLRPRQGDVHWATDPVVLALPANTPV